jgi:hypothetical protein
MLKCFSTIVNAVNPKTGKMQLFFGDVIFAKSREEAQNLCDTMGYEFYIVHDEMVSGQYLFNLN